MKKLMIKKELKQFKLFKNSYKFNFIELKERVDGLYFANELIQGEETGTISEGETFLNVGFKFKGNFSKALSNLFPYEFKFKGKKVASIESVFQGIKFSNKKEQDLVLKYAGLTSNNIKCATTYNWQNTQTVYWQGKPIKRDSVEYESFVDELCISAIQNPLYRNVLKQTKKYILHSMGETDKTKTVFTRFEFEKQLNILKDFLKGK